MPSKAVALTDLLIAFSIPVQNWGAGKAKSLDDLLSEIDKGECFLRLDKGGIHRVTEIVKMRIRHPDSYRLYLIEVGEYLPNGQFQERSSAPSGQIKFGETPEQCLIRELDDELGFKKGQYHFLPGKVETEIRQSKSYPGLETIYVIHWFVLELFSMEIPMEGEFTREDSEGTKIVFKWAM